MGFRVHQQATNDLQTLVTGSQEFRDRAAQMWEEARKRLDSSDDG